MRTTALLALGLLVPYVVAVTPISGSDWLGVEFDFEPTPRERWFDRQDQALEFLNHYTAKGGDMSKDLGWWADWDALMREGSVFRTSSTEDDEEEGDEDEDEDEGYMNEVRKDDDDDDDEHAPPALGRSLVRRDCTNNSTSQDGVPKCTWSQVLEACTPIVGPTLNCTRPLTYDFNSTANAVNSIVTTAGCVCDSVYGSDATLSKQAEKCIHAVLGVSYQDLQAVYSIVELMFGSIPLLDTNVGTIVGKLGHIQDMCGILSSAENDDPPETLLVQFPADEDRVDVEVVSVTTHKATKTTTSTAAATTNHKPKRPLKYSPKVIRAAALVINSMDLKVEVVGEPDFLPSLLSTTSSADRTSSQLMMVFALSASMSLLLL
ncbi:hypothetical protein HK101_003573 [Irineochytrium annulatum]|nr:hypothetical protein HK101_003573 [Irineochytrium annulatum]